VLGENRHTRHHQALIEGLILKLKTDSKVQIIVSLDRRPMQQVDEVIEDESFGLALGFSSLDTQIYYQGSIKSFDFKDKLDFYVSEYAGGNEATNLQLCHLYREAYKRRIGIPNVTPESINEQLAIPGCSYLVMFHKDELIGQVTLFIHQRECYVDSIYVKRTHWGTGAADKLTQSLFNYAKTEGCQTVAGTAASNNHASRALMERFGLVAQYKVKRMILSL
jgi:predicted acetyltransferase